MLEKLDKVHILLCGYYFQANTGDDLLQESISRTLSQYGEVKVTSTESFDAGLIDWCHLLVIGAGSLVTPRGIGGYDHAKYADDHGKKVVYYSQTIEEGHPLFREHLSRADLITVRDSKSKEVVEANGFRAVVAADPIFTKKRRTIGLSLRSWVNEPAAIVRKLAAVFDNLAVDCDLIFMPFTEAGTDTESDVSFHERIIQSMKNKPRTGSYADNIDKVDLLIGMRLHALITAINAGKQVLAIEYDAKIGRIFSDLALNDRVVSYGEMDKIPQIVRGKIFSSDKLATREKVNEALIAVICADICGDRKPAVSIVMPTYNRSALLKEAIDSVVKQSLSDWELVLIDDGSADDTQLLVRSYGDDRIRYYNFGHNGISYSRNIGSLLSRGDIIAVADSDDINLPNRLEVSYKRITDCKADIVYSSMLHFSSDGHQELIPSQPFSLERLHQSNFIFHPTVAYRREVALQFPYSEDLEMVEDYHMYLRAADKGYIFYQEEEALVMHRIHEGQISSERSEEMAEIHEGLVQSKGMIRKREGAYSSLVSVIMPTFNRPTMLKKAVQSVLAQSYQHFELIVVNDAGTDVADVIKAFHDERIVYISLQENQGLPAARNTGLKAAKGEYIAYLDDDDVYYSSHLETLVGYLKNGPCKVAYSDSYHVNQTLINGKYATIGKRVKFSRDYDKNQLLIANYIPVINIMHKKDLIETAGFFDEDLDAHEDWDMWIRLSQLGDFHHIRQVTAEVSERNDGTTMTSRDLSPYLRTMRLIHERYAPLVKDPAMRSSQKEAEDNIFTEIQDKFEYHQMPDQDDQLKEKGLKRNNEGNGIIPEHETVTVIVVNYNGKKYLEACFNSLLQVDRNKILLEIVMVDNLSIDGSVSFVKEKFPGITIVENDVNNFARALNLGIEQAKGDYIAFLNNDAVVDRKWLEGLLAVMARDEKIGAVQSKILFADRKTINSVGVEEEEHFYFKDIGFNERDHGQYEMAREMAYYTGGSVLLRRACIDCVGRVDEDFILFFEDVDYGIRCKKAGWKIFYAPESVVYHKYHGMASMELASYFSSRNRLLCLAKHFPLKLSDSVKTSKFYLNNQQENLYQSLIQAARKLIAENSAATSLNVFAEIKDVLIEIYGTEKTKLFFSQVEVLTGLKQIKMGIYDHALKCRDGEEADQLDIKPSYYLGMVAGPMYMAAELNRPVLAIFNQVDQVISLLQKTEQNRKACLLRIAELNRVLAEKDKQVHSLTEWATGAEAYAKTLAESSAVERAEVAKQVQSLSEWATGADAYAKSLETEVARLGSACKAHGAEIEILKGRLSRIQSHWLFKLKNFIDRSGE